MTAPVPIVRPFRALRYDVALGDLSAVICPPYDVVTPAERERLLARDPRNAVRVELPVASPGAPRDTGAEPRDPYRRAADTLRAWRADGTLRLDPDPSLYAYEERYRWPREGPDAPWRTQRGFFAVLRLEPFGEGVRPHERTFSAPKEDRLRLLRVTATNTSPIVLLSDDRTGRTADLLEGIASAIPTAEATDDAGIRHRIWALPADDPVAGVLTAGAEAAPLTIADGHHRYETALRYRDERRRARGGTPRDDGPGAVADSPFDHVLVLVLDAALSGTRSGPLILPTHRLVRGDAAVAEGLIARASTHFQVTPCRPADLVAAFSPPFRDRRGGRLGLLVRGEAYQLGPRPEALGPLFPAGTPEVLRRLDVAVLEAVLAPLATPDASDAGQGPGVARAPGQVSYTHDAQEARRAVESGAAAVAFLLRPTPVGDVMSVAAAGALMPQKSTYFYPKAATGLVMYPLE